MTKTICDICGKEMPTAKFIDTIENMNFCISSHGRIWDICTECRVDLNRWMTIRKQSCDKKEAGVNNTVCKNFEYNEKADGILELISLNCDKCEFDGNCDIKTAYHNAKDYGASMEFVVDKKEAENE